MAPHFQHPDGARITTAIGGEAVTFDFSTGPVTPSNDAELAALTALADAGAVERTGSATDAPPAVEAPAAEVADEQPAAEETRTRPRRARAAAETPEEA